MTMHDVDLEETRGWFTGRIPTDWFSGPVTVSGDREEILVVGDLPDVEVAKGASDAERSAARRSRVDAFRESTREARMAIARDAEHRLDRRVAWGVTIGGERTLFTTLSVPVMTRLRMRERAVLDTLVDAGVARSRSDALAWCVRLVGDHQGEWIDALRTALASVESVRAEGPTPS
ncbi:MAG TPA: hypothetical protein VEG29_04350 [Candidatus Binatia bacterium]|nr:hypothetical protein [Candidatus Binatia bacterium]